MGHDDYYRILGLSHNASADEIKKAYRKLAMQYHPDRNLGKEEWATDKLKEINEAFGVLGDSNKRRQYDGLGEAIHPGDFSSSRAADTTLEELLNDFDGGGLGFGFPDNVFGDDLGATGFNSWAFRRRFAGRGNRKPQTQEDVYLEDLFEQAQSPRVFSLDYEIVLSKEQAFNGVEKELVRKGKRLDVRIPAGIKTGTRIRLRNALETTDGQPGDIVITIRVR